MYPPAAAGSPQEAADEIAVRVDDGDSSARGVAPSDRARDISAQKIGLDDIVVARAFDPNAILLATINGQALHGGAAG